MNRTLQVALAAGLIVFCVGRGFARIRPQIEDAELVARSELILAGHFRDGSVRFIAHARPDGKVYSWEHHATLVVREVLKGALREQDIEIVIYYGLGPFVDGKRVFKYQGGNYVALRPPPKGKITIRDTGASLVRPWPLVEDARQDALWFLHRIRRDWAAKPVPDAIGIRSPEDLQATTLKDYFLGYLSADPGKAARTYAAKHPSFAPRVERSLDWLAVQRILKLQDASVRARQLAPYLVRRKHWNRLRLQREAMEAMVGCGGAAGPVLLRCFDETDDDWLRRRILMAFWHIDHRPAVDRLIALLDEHGKFWATQDVKQGWRDDETDRELGRKRRRAYGEMRDAVLVLRKRGDPRADEPLARAEPLLRRLENLMHHKKPEH